MDQNVFKMLGVERRELSYSNFLAWLLHPDVNGNVEAEFLRKLLGLIDKEYSLSDSSINVDREKEKDNSIADIVVNSDNFLLVIENKVKSGEGEKQTDRVYNDWKGSDKDEIFVYLTPEYREDCDCDEFEHITYTQIKDILEDMDKAALDTRPRIIIADFIEALEVNNLVEFDGFRKKSRDYIEMIQEIEEKENKWREDAEQFFKEIKKKLETKIDEDEWEFTTRGTNIEISKKNWENIHYKCALNDSHIRKGIMRIGIYADSNMENREGNLENFKDKYDGEWDTFSKAAWIKEGKREYFDKLMEGKKGLAENVTDELYKLLIETEDPIEYALKE